MNLSDAYKNKTTNTKITKTVTNATLQITAAIGVVNYAEAQAWADSSGVWWLSLILDATLPSEVGTSHIFGSSNVVFHATARQTASIYASYGAGATVFVPANGSAINTYSCGSNAANYIAINGIFRLKQAPTWAAANLDN